MTGHPLNPEERNLLATAYDLMRRDAQDGSADAMEGLTDPFWVWYADLVLGGHERVMQRIKQLRKAQRGRRRCLGPRTSASRVVA